MRLIGATSPSIEYRLSNTMSFGRRRPGRREQRFEMVHVVVAEDLLLAARLAHALDHRIVVQARPTGSGSSGSSLAMVEMPVSFET